MGLDRRNELITSLGVPLVPHGERDWHLDLSQLRLFKGLSVIARMLGEAILEQTKNGNSDIHVVQRIIPEITPELAQLDMESVHIDARRIVIGGFVNDSDLLQSQLRTVFGTLQRPRWGSVLFPEVYARLLTAKKTNTTELSQNHPELISGSNPVALLFPFNQSQQAEQGPDPDDSLQAIYFLVERDVAGQFLRITIESALDRRLNLEAIPHTLVEDLGRRSYLQGLTRITETIYQGLLRECENNRTEYTDHSRRHTHFFQQLNAVGLSDSEFLSIRWPMQHIEYLVRTPRKQIINFLKRTLICLEDRSVIDLLLSGEHIHVISGKLSAYLDLSRRGRCLNISLKSRRAEANLDFYLERMPHLTSVARKNPEALKGCRVFLIHHITGEILATIKALESMQMDSIHTLFVKYAGVVPAEYQEALLSLPENRFQFSGLQRIESNDSIEGYYVLSRQYSELHELDGLDEMLRQKRLAYFAAMRFVAGHLFFREFIKARTQNEKMLLVEDGGYLAPDINQYCLAGTPLVDVLESFGLDPTSFNSKTELTSLNLKNPLSEFLEGHLHYTIEHTRNGFNRLEEIQSKYKTLYFPAGSIAISNIKRERESEEVSISILHAIESILHGQGLVFSERVALVLGSRGAIGHNLMEDLSPKLGNENISGIDIVNKIRPDTHWQEVQYYRKLDESIRRRMDVCIGVVGQSILKEKELEDIILYSHKPAIFFASGSTKTVEFSDLSLFLQKLQRSNKPGIGDVEVELEMEPVRDPQTHHIVAHRIRIYFINTKSTEKTKLNLIGKHRDLYLLGGLTPINFLFYGVPTETIDSILGQLLQLTVGMLKKIRKGFEYPDRLLAVDREIDPDGEFLSQDP